MAMLTNQRVPWNVQICARLKFPAQGTWIYWRWALFHRTTYSWRRILRLSAFLLYNRPPCLLLGHKLLNSKLWAFKKELWASAQIWMRRQIEIVGCTSNHPVPKSLIVTADFSWPETATVLSTNALLVFVFCGVLHFTTIVFGNSLNLHDHMVTICRLSCLQG